MADVVKFLFFKLDEECGVYVPERFSDVPVILDPAIPEEERQNYTQIRMQGSALDIHMLDLIMFRQEEQDPFDGIFDQKQDDGAGEVPDNGSSATRA